MKMNFEYLEIEKWMLQKVKAEKVGEEDGVICPVSMFCSRLMILKLSKKVHFLQVSADRYSNLDPSGDKVAIMQEEGN